MRSILRLTGLTVLFFPCVVLLGSAAPIQLTGTLDGTVIPLRANIIIQSIPLQNDTGISICAFLLQLEGGDLMSDIESVQVLDDRDPDDLLEQSEDEFGDTDFDADDNGNGRLDNNNLHTDDDLAAPEADDIFTYPGPRLVRIIDRHQDRQSGCIPPDPERTFILLMRFGYPPGDGATLRVEPLDFRGLFITGDSAGI